MLFRTRGRAESDESSANPLSIKDVVGSARGTVTDLLSLHTLLAKVRKHEFREDPYFDALLDTLSYARSSPQRTKALL